MEFTQAAIENFKYTGKLFDLAIAVRVGVLDGRHPGRANQALASIRRIMKPGGKLFIDGGDPLREIILY